MKYYYTYEIKIINENSNLNECYYYGKHETSNLNDNYFGSGVILRNYINKYGTQHLVKTILAFYPNREQLSQAEKELVDTKRMQLGDRCLNRHEGGTGGRWVEYCSPEEYYERCQKVRFGVALKTTAIERSARAKHAGLCKRNVSTERRAQWIENYKQAYRNMSEEQLKNKYTKVSNSLKNYYNNPENSEKIKQRQIKNKQTNIEIARKWREEFKSIFGCTPESFRKYNKMGQAITLYKNIKSLDKGTIAYEVNKFMESIN